MIIELKKFGDILTSRKAGGEALAAFLPTLKSLGSDEKIKIDFKGVSVLTPSWADEFIGKLWIEYGEKVEFINDDNPSVQSALQFAKPKLDLERIKVFEDKIAFDEKANRAMNILTFPYGDEDALKILKNSKIKKVHISPVDSLSDSRLNSVIKMLEEAGIETKI